MNTLLRLDGKRWLLLISASFAFIWWAGLGDQVRLAFEALASQPDVQTAFTDAEHGRMDALLMLVSVVALAPLTSFVAVMALAFVFIVVAMLFEPVLRAFHLPSWISVAIVLVGAVYGAYALRWAWLPQAVQLGGMVARAWVVYFSTPLPMPH